MFFGFRESREKRESKFEGEERVKRGSKLEGEQREERGDLYLGGALLDAS